MLPRPTYLALLPLYHARAISLRRVAAHVGGGSLQVGNLSLNRKLDPSHLMDKAEHPPSPPKVTIRNDARRRAFFLSRFLAGSILSLRRAWGIKGLWVSMTYVLFGVRMASHLWRFNSRRGPFGPSAFLEESRNQGEGVQANAHRATDVSPAAA